MPNIYDDAHERLAFSIRFSFYAMIRFNDTTIPNGDYFVFPTVEVMEIIRFLEQRRPSHVRAATNRHSIIYVCEGMKNLFGRIILPEGV